MPPTFCPDWRCASTGMSDLDANRIGISTQTQLGVWGDWSVAFGKQHDPPSYRILVNQRTEQIVGATLYGPGAGELIPWLRFAIDEGLTIADLHAMVCSSANAEPNDVTMRLEQHRQRQPAPLPR